MIQIYGTRDLEIIQKNHYTLRKHALMMRNYGALISELDITKLGKNMSITTALVRIFHKLVPAASIFIFEDHPEFTIMTFNLNSLAYLCYILHLKPFRFCDVHRYEVFNEVVVLIVTYHIYLFTDYSNIV
jgi:hypothetical protein